MADNARAAVWNYSGVTTTTNSDTVTFTPAGKKTPTRCAITNRHASLILYVRTDGTVPTAAAAAEVIVILPATTVYGIPLRTSGAGRYSKKLSLISSAACDYSIIAE